jgi:hypothetical protein
MFYNIIVLKEYSFNKKEKNYGKVCMYQVQP